MPDIYVVWGSVTAFWIGLGVLRLAIGHLQGKDPKDKRNRGQLWRASDYMS